MAKLGKVMFRSVVGSHAWKMNGPSSDRDIFEVYVVPTRRFFVSPHPRSYYRETVRMGKKVDVATHEVGSVFAQLVKGNMITVMNINSPIVLKSSEDFDSLRRERGLYLSKVLMKSMSGMVMGNIQRFGEEDGEHSRRWSKLDKFLATAENLLVRGELTFNPTPQVTLSELRQHLEQVEKSVSASRLPKAISKRNEKKLWERLVKIRIENLASKA